MPAISGSVTVLANTRSGNVVAGEVFEIMQRNGIVNFLLTGAAIGLTADILVGGQAEILNGVLPIRAAGSAFPIKPDDSLVIAAAFAGQRLFVDIINSTGGDLIAQFLLEIAYG